MAQPTLPPPRPPIQCLKCGSRQAPIIHYCGPGQREGHPLCEFRIKTTPPTQYTGEHLHIECFRCRHVTFRPCLDEAKGAA